MFGKEVLMFNPNYNSNANRVNLTQKITYPWKSLKELKVLCGYNLERVSAMLFAYLLTFFANDNDGKVGKSFEVTLKSLIFNRLVKSININGHHDLTSKLFKEYFSLDYMPTVEVKTACGQMPNQNDFIVYCPLVNPNENILTQASVFSWEDWNDMFSSYSGRGQMVKWNESRNTFNIQSFYGSETVRPKASKPIRNHIDNWCDMCVKVSEMSDTFANMKSE